MDNTSWTTWLVENHLGDWASVAGVGISLIGFAATLWNVVRSKRAAKQAESAANEVRQSMKLFDTASDFAEAVSVMDEIRRLHRAGAWVALPDRYSVLRRLLLTLRHSDPDLTERDQANIQAALQNVVALARQVEKALADPSRLNVPRINSMISNHADQLHEMLVLLRDRAGNAHG